MNRKRHMGGPGQIDEGGADFSVISLYRPFSLVFSALPDNRQARGRFLGGLLIFAGFAVFCGLFGDLVVLVQAP